MGTPAPDPDPRRPPQVLLAAGLRQLQPAALLDQCQPGSQPLPRHDRAAGRDRRAPGVPGESRGARTPAPGSGVQVESKPSPGTQTLGLEPPGCSAPGLEGR